MKYIYTALLALVAIAAYAADPVSLQQMLQSSPKETAPQGQTSIVTVRGGVIRRFSIMSTATLVPVASTTAPGIVKVGTGLAVLPDGTLNNTGIAGVASFNGRGGAVTPASGDYSIGQISGASTVASTGSYADLSNKPTIPAAQVNSDWNAGSGAAQILNKPTIPTSLSQLSQSSSYRTVTDAEKEQWNNNSSPVQSFNGRTGAIQPQSGDYTAVMVGADVLGSATSVQTNLNTHSANTNNPHAVTKAQVGLANVDNTSDLSKPISTATQTALNLKANTSELAPVATSGAYADLTGKPTIPAAQVNSDWSAASGVTQILNKPSLGTAAAKDVPASGNASSTQVVMGNDDRLRPITDSTGTVSSTTVASATAVKTAYDLAVSKLSPTGSGSQLIGINSDQIAGVVKTVRCAGTDDTAAIQAALSSTASTVELDGYCRTSSTLTINRPMVFRGRGQDGSTLSRVTDFGDTLLISPDDPTTAIIYGITVSGIKFSQSSVKMTSGAHIHIKSSGNVTINDVATNNGWGGILAEKVEKVDVKHWKNNSGSLYTTSDATYGFWAKQGVYAAEKRNYMITLDDWFINTNQLNKYIKDGIIIEDNDTLKITNGHVQGYYGAGIKLAPPTGSYLVQAVLHNNYIDSGAPDATSQGIVVADTGGTLGDITISNSPMNGESTVNTYGGKNAIYVNSPKLNGLKIFGNTIIDWEEDGINVVAGRNIAIQGNNVSANNQSNTGKDGIRVAANLSEIAVENNQIGVRTIFDIPNTQAVGLEVGSGCTGSFTPNVYGTRNTTNYTIASPYNATAQTGVSAGTNITISGTGVVSSSVPASFTNTAITTDQITAGTAVLISAGFSAAGGATVTGTSPDVTMAVSASFVAYGPTVDTFIDAISYTTSIAGPILIIRNSGSANTIFKHSSSKLRMIGGKDRTLPPLHSIMFVKLTTAAIWQEIGLPDADTLDGQHGSYYAPLASPSFTTPSLGAATATTINGTSIPTSSTLATSVASGTAALGTSAIASGACAAAVTVAGTSVLTTDVIDWGFNVDPTSTTGYAPSTSGMLTIIAYPTAGNANFKVCNNTGSSVTPGAVTLNWRVRR